MTIVSSLDYSLLVEDAGEGSVSFVVKSDRYCMTVNEDSGFATIRKRLTEPMDNAKSSFVSPCAPNHV